VYADSVQQVIDELGRLPGIGPRSAQRLALHLMKVPVEDTTRLTVAIDEMKA
jgi:recombination protein RecR